MLCALWLILESPGCLLFSFLWKDAKYVSSGMKGANHPMFSQSWMKEHPRSVERCISQNSGWEKREISSGSQSFVFCSSYVINGLLGEQFWSFKYYNACILPLHRLFYGTHIILYPIIPRHLAVKCPGRKHALRGARKRITEGQTQKASQSTETSGRVV